MTNPDILKQKIKSLEQRYGIHKHKLIWILILKKN